jgi:hypothetical protein
MTIRFYGVEQVYSESGVDLTLLRSNLERSVEDRLLKTASAAGMVGAFRAAGLRKRGEPDAAREVERMGEFDPQALLRQLATGGVEFVLVGGLAMSAHGSAYVTSDLDVCYARTPQNLDALAGALAPLHPVLRGAPAGLPFRLDALTLKAGLNFTLTTDRGDIDLLGEMSGIGGYEKALAMSEERTVFGRTIRLLSLDGLIAAKKAAGRAKDRLHLLELEELKKLREPNE